jgi:transposase
VVDQEADEVAESAVEAIFDHVLSSGCGWRYLPMYFWMTHHLVPTWSWMSYSFYS